MTKHTTNLTDAQFKLLYKYLPKVKITKPRTYTLHSIFNGILYILKTGCQWNMLPQSFPPFKLVHYYFRKLVVGYKLEKIICHLNKVLAKKSKNTIVAPDLVLIVDTKSIRTSEYFDSKHVGRDGHKKIKGIKLCPVVDRLKRCWRVTATSANQSEYTGVTKAIEQTLNSRIKPHCKFVIGDRYYDSQKLRDEYKQYYNLDFISDPLLLI
jgi:putative transposase